MPETLSAPQTMQVTAQATAELPSVMGSQEQWWVAPTAEAQPIISVVPKVETNTQQQESTQTVEQHTKVSKSYRTGLFVGSVLGKFNKLGTKPPLFTAQEIAAAKAANVMPLEPYQNSMNAPVQSQPEAIWYAAPHPQNTAEAITLTREQLQALRGQVPMPSPEAPQVATETMSKTISYDMFGGIEKSASDRSEGYLAPATAEIKARYDAKLQGSEAPEDKNTAELSRVLPMTSGVLIGERQMMLSDIVRSPGGRMHAVMYTELADGRVAPRLFYKSNSDGDWRVSPHVEKWHDQDGKKHMRYSKGETMDYGYVRETRLDDDVREALVQKEAGAKDWSAEYVDWLTDKFTEQAVGKNNTYEKEVNGVEFPDMTIPRSKIEDAEKNIMAFMPGHGFEPRNGRTAAEVFAAAEIPFNKMPAFTKQLGRRTITQHPQLGEVVTEALVSNDGRNVWHFSSDKKGRIWISGVTRNNEATPSTYGTDAEVLSMGILDNKPVEYISQLQGLKEGQDYAVLGNSGYADISKLLDKLPVVKDYRASRGITRAA